MRYLFSIFGIAIIIGVITDVAGITVPAFCYTSNNSELKNSGMNQKEMWKDVEGFEDYYQISSSGLVKSYDRECWNGGGYFIKKGRLLKQCFTGAGYLMVGVHKQGEVLNKSVHRLVAIHFVDNPENKPCVNHLDGDKTNNNDWNLEWVTHKENSIHGVKLGLISNYKPIIQLNINGNIIRDYNSITDAQKETGISKSQIGSVCNGHRKTAHGYKWKFKD